MTPEINIWERITDSVACPVCLVDAGRRCLTDRPIHLARADIWDRTSHDPGDEDRKWSPK